MGGDACCRPGYTPGRLAAAAILAVAVLVASIILSAKLAEILYPLVEDARRVLGVFSPLSSRGAESLPLPVSGEGLPVARGGSAIVTREGPYAVLEVYTVSGGSCRVYVNGTLAYRGYVDAGTRLRLYIARVGGRVVASPEPPGGRFSSGVVAVDCGGVQMVREVR